MPRALLFHRGKKSAPPELLNYQGPVRPNMKEHGQSLWLEAAGEIKRFLRNVNEGAK
jgi:hypothetical protein